MVVIARPASQGFRLFNSRRIAGVANYFDELRVAPDTKVKLKDYASDATAPFKSKEEAAEKLLSDVTTLADLQETLYAQNQFGLLIVLQGMDASGKDGTVKHVMSSVNPTGCQVTSFKQPSTEELDHDYLWRHAKALPPRGNIGIFNRSHYEEVLVVRVHPELLARERMPTQVKNEKLWDERFRQINDFEEYLTANGIEVLKFFLHISKKEQKRRFLARLDSPEKNWKFEPSDVRERDHWDDYIDAYEDMLSHTSTKHAPWYIVPADLKWFSHVAVADIVVRKLQSLQLKHPTIDDKRRKELDEARKLLEK